jgi:hypothetical protein
VKRLALVILASCSGDIAPPWQLAHERIIAVRATPPHIPAGATSTLDVLVGHVGSGLEVVIPGPADTTVVSPTGLTSNLVGATFTAPGETQLDQIRGDLGLGPSDPVPIEVEVVADTFEALKTIYVGDSSDNPTLDGLLVNGVPPPTDTNALITVPANVDVPLFVDADDDVDNVNWLTSCGTMNDFDIHDAFLHVNPSDPQTGQLAVVLRDESAGVVWQFWSVVAQ